jgi:uncharacterized repeat protein (TIGR01451 family)
MKARILNRIIGSSILLSMAVWLSATARGQASLSLLAEAFPGVDLSYLGWTPKDYAPIAVSSARTWGNPNGVEVVFTAPVDPATATNAANYTITPGIAVQRAVMGTNAWTVKLTTATMADAVLHTLAVSNVQDLSSPPNTIAAGSTVPILKAQGVITRKVFTGIGGNWLSSLTNNTKFPNSPDNLDWPPSFEAPSNQGDYYGDQMIGYICPPATGDYQFFIASDNEGQLYLSTDATPANKALMASVPDATGSRQWSKYTSQSSAYVKLEAGRIYYVEALMAESTGNDYLAVTWRMRGMPAPVDGDAPIPGGFLSSITPSAPASIVTAPQDLTVSERQTAAFGVVAGGTPTYAYQWRKNGLAIPGATATNYVVASAAYSDNNAQLSVIVSNSFSSITSGVARLTVLTDTNPPTLSRVSGSATMEKVTVGFSEPVDPDTANNPRNYYFNGGLAALTAQLQPDGSNIVLVTTRQTPGQVYSLTVTGVTDVAILHNPVNATTNFTAWVLTRGFLHRDIYYNLAGGAISDLTNSARFPDSVDAANEITSLETGSFADYYGQRVFGYLFPPLTGYYSFYMASDDQGLLFLSSNTNADNKIAIAFVPSAVNSRTYNNYASQQSPPIFLEAGKAYYLEALHKESYGGDHLSVAWQLPGALPPNNGDPPIGGSYLAAYANPVGPSLVITQQPLPAIAVLESAFTNLTVGVISSYAQVFYQWKKNGIDITGATSSSYTTPRLLRMDDGAAFQCFVSIPGLSRTSSVAVVTVTPDNAPPQALSAATLVGSTNVGLCFSELMGPASVTNPANYTLSIGGAVTSATLRSDGQSVSLAVTALGFTNYTVHLNNLKDYAGNPLPANTTVPVTAVGMENTDVGIAGDPVEIGSAYSCSASNFDVVAGGSDIWNNRDGTHFIYDRRDGDFDGRVRVARLDNKATWTFAGFHVRESLYAGSRGLKVILTTTNGANTYKADYRAQTDGSSSCWPGNCQSAGVTFPNAWVRLTRTNDLFTAWRGTNGVDWTAFAQITLSFTGRVYVGLCACPVNNNVGQATTAWFRDFSLSPDYPLPAPLDLTIKKASDPGTAFALNDVYQVTPAGAQVLTQSANPTNPASFMVKVENDSVVAQSLVLRAVESADAGWTTAYLWSGSNITALITNTTGFALSNLPPGSAEFVQVDLLPGSRLAGAATKSTTIRVATDLYTRSQRDVVQATAVNEVNYQPDMLVRRLTDVVYNGGGIYNSTGSNQTKSVTSDTGKLVVYPLQLVNVGNLTNVFTVAGTAGSDDWTVRYFDALVGGSDITAEVTGGGAGISLLPGASWEFRAEVTASLAVPPGASNILYVTGRSAANLARSDTVKIVTLAQITTNVPQTGVFTADTDFERGTRVGTVYGGNQLTLSSDSVTWPFIWVPNSNEGTVSKVDVRTGAELGRYRTCPTGVTGNPSRTTIDQYGNCWVANRQSGTVVKIGLLESGQYSDRNTNGLPDTSYDANGDGDISSGEMLPWGQDECVLYEVVVIPGKEGTYTPGTYTNGYVNDYWNPGPRGIAVDYSGNVWAGTHDSQKFYYLNGSTAAILRTNDLSSVAHTCYGAVIDGNGILWSSGYRESGQNNILRMDPTDNSMSVINFEFHTYGLSLDHNNHLFVSGHQESKLSRINVLTATREWTSTAGYLSRGVAVTDDEDVWVASSSEGNVWRFSNDGVFKGKISVGTTPTGVSVDSAGKVWVVNDGDEYIKRIDPAIGAYGAIDLSKRIIGGLHYGYSDMTGIIARSTTGRFGTWTVIHDAIVHFTQWGMISWNGYQPSGNNIGVRVRSSDDGSVWANWETATNGVPLSTTPPGRFLQVEVSLRTLPGALAPALYDLTVQPLSQRTADLAITQSVFPGTATNEHSITWTLSATNRGPQDARGVYVTDTLPAGITVTSVTNSSSSVAQLYRGLRCVLGELKAGSNFTMTIVANVTNAGILTNSVAIGHYEVDPAPANNQSVLTTVALPNPCLPPPAGLVSWWPGDGNANDLTGNHPGTSGGNLVFPAGKVGQAFQFDGVDDSVDLGTWFNSQVFTVVMWVKAGPSQVAYADIIDNNHTGSRSWVVQHNNTSDATKSYFGWGVQGIGGTDFGLLKGVWQHLALCLDSNRVGQVYLDGALVGTFGGSGSVTYDGSQFLRLGRWGGGGRNFNGQLDEVAVFNRALSPAEIFALYDAGASGECKATFAPSMHIAPAAGLSVNVSWPVGATGFQLESTTALGTPWQTWPGTPALVGDQLVVNIPATNAARFFRLKKQ